MARDHDLREILAAAIGEYRDLTKGCEDDDKLVADAGDDLAFRVEAALQRGTDFRRIRPEHVEDVRRALAEVRDA